MFSATKFVVAGAVVALFGGVLMAGVLTQPTDTQVPAAVSPSTISTADLLPGVDLVTEVVEPGVYRVLDDGVDHDLSGLDTVEVAHDGSVWISDIDRLYRLGHEGWHSIDRDHNLAAANYPLQATSPDGSLLLVSGQGVYHVDPVTAGEPRPAEQDQVGAPGPDLPATVRWGSAISAAPDGYVWASWSAGDSMNSGDTRIVRYDGTTWDDLSGMNGLGALIDLEYSGNYICDIEDGSAGEIWVGVCGAGGWGFGDGGLFRHRESGWDRVPVFDDFGRPDLIVSDAVSVSSGPDGTIWAMVWPITQGRADAAVASRDTGDWSWLDEVVDEPLAGTLLIRYRGGRWSAYPWDTVSPEQQLPSNSMHDAGDHMAVDARGAVWFVAGDAEFGAEALASFDGQTVRRYPAMTDIRDLSIDSEGRTWVASWNGLYVITPEAVAVAE